MDTHWFSSSKRGLRGLAGKGLRIASAFALLVLTFGPIPNAPLGQPTPTAEADALDWSFMRPPLSDEEDTDDDDGFDLLTEFDEELHAMAVGPNGDLFAGGGTGDIYRSTDGGLKWRQAITCVPGGADIMSIAVSNSYPGDGFVMAVFSNHDAGDGGDAEDGIAWSDDGGLEFDSCVAGTAWAQAGMDTTEFLSLALSSDFDWDDEEGAIAIGGHIEAGTSSVWRITTASFKATPAGAGWIGLTLHLDHGGPEAPGDRTLHLAYSNDPDGGILGRLFVDVGTGTFGQLLSATAFTNTGGGLIVDEEATAGEIAFDDTTDFRAEDRWWAAVSLGDETGGVFRFSSGGWENRTVDDPDCNTGFSSLFVSGSSGDTRVVAAQDEGVIVCRTTNNGSSWSDNDADGGDDQVDEAQVGTPVESFLSTRLAGRRSDPNVMYWSTSGDLGGVFKSTNNGSGWMDTGLTNDLYEPDGAAFDFISDSEVIVRVEAAGDRTALFYTTNFGTGASWRRVFRAPDISGVELPDDFETSRVAWGFRSGTGEERIVRSTDGGQTWFPTTSDPVDDEEIEDMAGLTASTAYIGLSNEGEVWRTTDGGSSWTMLSKDFGRGIDEFDFEDETVFFVTALDNDNIMKVWQTRDGGATFTQLGDAPWGTACEVGDANFRLADYDATANTGYGIFMSEDTCSEKDIYRLQIGTDTTWSELDLNQEWESVGSFSTPRGDGYALWMSADDDGGCSPCLRYTVWPLTGDPDDMDRDSGTEQDNLILYLPTPPVPGSLNSRTAAGGTEFRVANDGVFAFMTLPREFREGPSVMSPLNNSSVPANTGDNGIPLTLRWSDIPNVEAYEIILGQNANLSDGAILGTETSNRMTVTEAVEALTQGTTYYWAVRVTACDVDVDAGFPAEDGGDLNECESPWSPISSFTVSTTSTQVTTPQPNLPVNGSQLPGLSTELSWNNPPGVTQVQVQVTPLNGDGPAINLIIGSAISTYVVPASVFGTGPYVMLPGATYTWRVRTTGSTSPTITETDPAWGPWSEPRTFTTRRPDAGTLQLVTPINGQTLSDTTPSVEWKNAAPDEFYYEVQVSADPNFNTNPGTATAAVFWNLVHGGQSTPPNTWTVPDANALAPGTYYWRVRQRLQATPAGSAEVGIAWSPAQRFVVQ